MPAHATTGDGLLTGLFLLSRVAQTGRSLADLAGVLRKLPQVLINVPVLDREQAATAAPVVAATEAVAAELGETGRILLRPSGTEQLVRVMVEAQTEEAARRYAERVAGLVHAASPTG
jgi:phosphoglucosamine mutase